MRFSVTSSAASLLAFTALLATGAVAKGQLGFALGVQNADGSCKSTKDFESDFDALKQVNSTTVRTYAASSCNSAANIIPAAKNKGFKVVLGVWPDTDDSFNQDLAALQRSVPGNEDTVRAITVGSEVFLRGSMTAQALLDKINTVKQKIPKVDVGFVDSWNKINDGTADPLFQGGVDYVLVNAFAFWQDTPLENAHSVYIDDMNQARDHVLKLAPRAYVATGETGWPTDGGTNYGKSVAGTANAKRFFDEAVCTGLTQKDWDVFFFEAFDEPWKPNSTGNDGSSANEKHWGLFTSDRKVKYDRSC